MGELVAGYTLPVANFTPQMKFNYQSISFPQSYSSGRQVSSPVRYAKFQSIRYFIDIDNLQNSLIDIDIDIDIFKNDHVDIDIDIDIFQIVLIDIDTDIDIFKISLSISIPISIFSKIAYRYFVDIDILTKIVDILSIFQKMPIYRQSISIFHQKNMKKVLNLLKKMIFLPKMSLSISIAISISFKMVLSISIFSILSLS